MGVNPYTFLIPFLKCVPLYWFYVNKRVFFQTRPKFNFLSPNIYTPTFFIFISCQRSPSALLLSPPVMNEDEDCGCRNQQQVFTQCN